MNLLKRDKSFRNFIICLVSIMFIGICYFVYQSNRSYPLGDSTRLEYIGKDDYGCWLVCDANPASVYYYATDMSPAEVVRYFKSAREYKSIEQDLSYTRIWLEKNNKNFIIEYYPDDARVDEKGFHTSKHLIGVASFDYKLARESL